MLEELGTFIWVLSRDMKIYMVITYLGLNMISDETLKLEMWNLCEML